LFFREFLDSAELDLTEALWSPWWNKPLVVEDADKQDIFPPLPTLVPKIDELMKGRNIHKHFQNNVLEILYVKSPI
jgi:hypothetical protein